MDAAPFLVEVGRALKAAALDAVLIGNAGAALQGAPTNFLRKRRVFAPGSYL